MTPSLERNPKPAPCAVLCFWQVNVLKYATLSALKLKGLHHGGVTHAVSVLIWRQSLGEFEVVLLSMPIQSLLSPHTPHTPPNMPTVESVSLLIL